MARAKNTTGNQAGFTLVELLVVVGIIVALATVSIVSVSQFSGKGEEGAKSSELATVQSAMDTMMASQSIQSITANNLSTLSSGQNNFTSLPAGTGAAPLLSYMRNNPTAYWYCWDITGKVVQLTAATTCA